MSAAIGIPIKNNTLNHLDGLDDFSLMDIFDMLEMADLAKVAPLSPRFHKIIMDHYIIPIYRLHEREISLIQYESREFRMFYNNQNSYSLITKKYDEMLVVLQTFGHIFRYLDIRTSSYDAGIQSYVNTHCTNAVQKITLKAYSAVNLGNIFFPNATTVVTDESVYLPNDPFQLNTAFPQMQKLVVKGLINLQHHYPKLTEVSFDLGPMGQHFTSSELSLFFRLNPQLRHVKTPAFNSATYLISLSELPNLENLFLELVQSTVYTVHAPPIVRFRYVKSFSLDVDAYMASSLDGPAGELLASAQFDQLESLSAYTRKFSNRDFLIDFMSRNTALQNVTMYSIFNEVQMAKLIDALPQLREVNLIWQPESLQSTLDEFLRHVDTSNHSLQILNVHFSSFLDITYEQLLESVPPGWNVKYAAYMRNSQILRLERSK